MPATAAQQTAAWDEFGDEIERLVERGKKLKGGSRKARKDTFAALLYAADKAGAVAAEIDRSTR